MRLVRVLALVFAVSVVAGCGDKDPNKDLKPISKDAPRPVKGSEGNTKGPSDDAPKVAR